MNLASNSQPVRRLKVAVIGAGSAGLSATKALLEQGFSPVCYEMGDRVGGLWVFQNKNGRSSAYRSLHINTSTLKMQFSDFPMRTDIGDFPSHEEIAAYFEAYAQRFDIHRQIRFSTEVVKCVPHADGYRLRLRDRNSGECTELEYDALVVANGHHFEPAFPKPSPSQGYEGLVMHSSQYIDPQTPHDLRDKRTLIVGMGNSAVDLACELSAPGNAHSVHVSARRGAWVLPKYILGKPLDQGGLIPKCLPAGLRRRVVTRAFQALQGKMSDYGLPEPDHLIGEAHPTVSSDFPKLVKSGRIQMRGAVESAEGLVVRFGAGASHSFDVIIYCTGYKVSFPFFDEEHLSAPGNRMPLYFRAFHPDLRRVFFVGLAQTIGAIMPVAEAQGRAIAAHLAGEYNLPSSQEMKEAITRIDLEMARRFVDSPRHTMQVDPEPFQRSLRNDLRRGKKRAQKGHGLPFPAQS